MVGRGLDYRRIAAVGCERDTVVGVVADKGNALEEAGCSLEVGIGQPAGKADDVVEEEASRDVAGEEASRDFAGEEKSMGCAGAKVCCRTRPVLEGTGWELDVAVDIDLLEGNVAAAAAHHKVVVVDVVVAGAAGAAVHRGCSSSNLGSTLRMDSG